MELKRIREKLIKSVIAIFIMFNGIWCSMLNKSYVLADLIIEDWNMKYAREERVTTAVDIIIIVIILILAVLAVFGITKMKKREKQDELDDETRMIQNKKEQDN